MRRIAWLVACITMIGACGSDDTSVSEPSPLTNDQASRLAQAGYSNLLAGGAEFEANSAFLGVQPSETVRLVGVVDWENHIGRATVISDGPSSGIVEVYWNETTVLERWPGMDDIVSSLGGPNQPWVARPPEPATKQIDRLLAILIGLALEQPENAILLQQTEGSAFLRDDALRGRNVEVLRYGNRNVYWLAADDGTMLRFEGNSAGGNAPTVVDLLTHGSVEVPQPDADDVISASAISEIYSAFAGG
jgi:hypothetical protein